MGRDSGSLRWRYSTSSRYVAILERAVIKRKQSNRPSKLDVLLQDLKTKGKIIPFRADLSRATGGNTSALLLRQIIFWWEVSGRRPFFKFKAPCGHPSCRPGDTWAEELDIGRHEFDSARKRIATRKTPDMSWEQACAEGKPVVYWITPGNLTYYAVNQAALAALLETAIYPPEGDTAAFEPSFEGNGSDNQQREQPSPNVENQHPGTSEIDVPKAGKRHSERRNHAFGKPESDDANVENQHSGTPESDVRYSENTILNNKEDADVLILLKKIKSNLQLKMTVATYNNLFADAELLSWDDEYGRATLALSSPYTRDWVQARMHKVVKRAFEEVCGREIALDYVSQDLHLHPGRDPP